MRAGGYTLTLLATQRTFPILRSLADGTKDRQELRRDAGFPAQSTLRSHLANLEAAGVTARSMPDSFPGVLEYDLTDAGKELLDVADVLASWLSESPQGKLQLGTDQARIAVKGLVDGWLAHMLAPLAVKPRSLTELDKTLTKVSYPTLERRLETMRIAEQVEVRERTGAGTPHLLTRWMRRGMAALMAAARHEHRNDREQADPVARADLESAVKVVAPLLNLPRQMSGLCQLSVHVPGDGRHSSILGLLEVKRGKPEFATVYPQREPNAWASGTAEHWFSTLIDGEPQGLKLSGDGELALTFFQSWNRSLFKPRSSIGQFPNKN